MKLLIDECLPIRLIELLQSKELDAVGVIEVARSATDEDILELAKNNGRILVTEDRGFGDHLVRDENLTIGVIILSGYRATHRINVEMQRIAEVVHERKDELTNYITIISPTRISNAS